MKWLLLLLPLSAFAQSHVSDLRVVDGKLYNCRHSTNWICLPLKKWALEVDGVHKDGLLVHEEGDKGNETSIGIEYVIKNLPGEKTATTGQKYQSPVFVMRIGQVTIGTKRLALYDFGIPTNAVAAPKSAAP